MAKGKVNSLELDLAVGDRLVVSLRLLLVAVGLGAVQGGRRANERVASSLAGFSALDHICEDVSKS